VDVQAEFWRAIRACGCLQPGDVAVLGVSGGADSLAMLHLFSRTRDVLAIKPHVLHLDHGIRGAEAQADADFVARMCREWDIPCLVERADVPALARRSHLTLEEAARLARYRALAGEAGRLGARVIAVAHNADDQAETVLMHFLRGSGLAGLRGMLPVTPVTDFPITPPVGRAGPGVSLPADCVIVRPLLAIPRADIEVYCAAEHLTPRLDRTNLDTTYFRNRLRREIVPLLETLIPGLRARLAHTAATVAADFEQLERDLDAEWPGLTLEESAGRIALDLKRWRGLTPSLQRAALRRAIAHLRANLRNIGFVPVEAARHVAHEGSTGAQATLPGGLVLRLDYARLVIAPAADRPPAPDWPLLAPGAAILVDTTTGVDVPPGWQFHLSAYTGPRSGPGWESCLADPWCAVLNLSAEDRADLWLRTRRPGDRFQPQGVRGTQKVNAFMINAKIAAVWRGRIPLLAAGDRIAWLCGWRVDERFVVKPQTHDVWLGRFEKD
jgi:tRNA(Ile)-lysidine synthetase-like protein